MPLQTRGQMRDAIRRHLNIVPPIDDPVAFPDAQAGDEPEYAPRPSNPKLNMFLENTVSDLNLASGTQFLTGIVRVPVDAQTENGPVRIGLEGDEFSGAAGFEIHQIRDAWWEIAATDEGSTTATRYLTAVDLDTLARERFRYHSYPPGLPYRYAVEGYAIWLIPAPTTAGTLVLRAGLGVLPPLHDRDTLHQFPSDCGSAFIDIVAAEVASSEIDDSSMQDLGRILLPKAQESRRLILLTLGRMHGKLDGHMSVATYRRRAGARR